MSGVRLDSLDPETRKKILAMIEEEAGERPRERPEQVRRRVEPEVRAGPEAGARTGRSWRLRLFKFVIITLALLLIAAGVLENLHRLPHLRYSTLPPPNVAIPEPRPELRPQKSQEVELIDWRNTGVDWAALEKKLEPYVFRITNLETGATGTAFMPKPENYEDHVSGKYTMGQQLADYIYTVYHIVGENKRPKFKVESFPGYTASGRHVADAWVLSRNEEYDLLELNWTPPISGDPGKAPEYGNAYELEPGDLVLIMGNPRNLWDKGSHPGPISTVGRVQEVDVSFKVSGRLFPMKHGLRIQADIAPGSSGSPVFNSKGEVVGMMVAGGIPEPDPVSGVNRIVGYAIMFPIKE